MTNRPRVTPDEVAKMKRLRKAGLSYAAIARAVGRSPGTARNFILGKRKLTRKSAADYQAEARAVPEHVLGADPPESLESDFSRVAEGMERRADKDELTPEKTRQRMRDIRTGRVKPRR